MKTIRTSFYARYHRTAQLVLLATIQTAAFAGASFVQHNLVSDIPGLADQTLNPAVGALSSSGLYTAPLSIASSQEVNVTAVSDADPTKVASASVTLMPGTGISVKVLPATVALKRKGTQQFQASVSGTMNTSVTWSISPSIGTISQTGLYRAPNNLNGSVAVTVTAKSVQDVAATGTALISLSR
jgi:hypothetical protein